MGKNGWDSEGSIRDFLQGNAKDRKNGQYFRLREKTLRSIFALRPATRKLTNSRNSAIALVALVPKLCLGTRSGSSASLFAEVWYLAIL